jgi:hypothetical protein
MRGVSSSAAYSNRISGIGRQRGPLSPAMSATLNSRPWTYCSAKASPPSADCLARIAASSSANERGSKTE